ncbi:hypothetical protein CHUAL_006497 [Chamberlinius hualienensis]
MIDLTLALFLIVLSSVSAQQTAKQNCDDNSFSSVFAAINGVSECTFPDDIFTADCVAASIPQLTSERLCSKLANGSVDTHNVMKTLDIIQNGLQNGSICGFFINPIPLPSYSMIIDELLAGTPFSGSCNVSKNTSVIRNVNHTEVNLIKDTDPLEITINIPDLFYDGLAYCTFTATLNETYAQRLNVSANQPLNISMYLIFQFNISIEAVSDIFLNDRPLEPNVENASSVVHTIITPIEYNPILKEFDVNQKIVSLDQQFMQASEIPKLYGNFISAIVLNSFKVVNQQC